MQRKRGELWAVVLAAGEGTRMARLTTMLYGKAVPKQFAAIDGERSFLQRTLDRLSTLVPPSRTVVVVAEAQLDYARAQLGEWKGVTVVPQPVDLGTGPGVFLPLCHILAADPEARVAILPADHEVRDDEAFVGSLRRAFRAAERVPSGVAVMGAPAERAESGLGWIVPEDGPRPVSGPSRVAQARTVRRVLQNTPAPVSELLFETGALRNTNIVVGRAAALWTTMEQHLPSQAEAFRGYLKALGRPGAEKDAGKALAQVYRDLLPADFSREVVAAMRGLAVVPMADAGWADCGTPERLLEALRGRPELAGLLAQLKRTRQLPQQPATAPVAFGAA
jgi:mannose-1-phosphate guanylyltransferase